MMNWKELYKGYLSRCKSKPLTYVEFVKLREGMLSKNKIEKLKKPLF